MEQMQNIVTSLILELQQNCADNAGAIDYKRYEATLLAHLQKLKQCNVSGSLPDECKHEKSYYCLKTGGGRCRKCKKLTGQ